MRIAASSLKVAVITNIAAPYRVALFERVSAHFRGFTVAFQSTGEVGRHWDLRPDLRFSAEFLSGRDIWLPGKSLRWNPGIESFLERTDPDVVVIGGFALAAAAGIGPCERAGRRLVIMNDGTEFSDPLRGALAAYRRWIVRRASGFIAASGPSARYFRKLGADPARTAIVQLTSDLTPFRALPIDAASRARARARFGMRGPTICFVGQMIKRKRPDEVLSAFLLAKREVPDLGLLVAGDGEELPALQRRAKASGAEAIRFLGHLDPLGVRDVFAASDLHLFPSVQEPYGLVVLESMAAGVPVVTTAAVGCAEDLIVHGKTGFLVGAGDVLAMATTIVDFLKGPASAEQMRAECRELAGSFDLPRAADDFVSAIEKFGGAAVRSGRTRHRSHKKGVQSRRRAEHYSSGLRVAYVTDSLAPYRVPFLDSVRRRGIDISVVVAGGGVDSAGAINTRVGDVPVRHIRSKRWWRSDVVAVCDDLSPDVLLIEHGARHSFAWTLLMDRSIDCAKALWTHGIENRERFSGQVSGASIGRWMQLRMADGVLCYDHATARLLSERLPGKPVGAAPNSTDGRPILAVATELIDRGREALRSRLGLQLPEYMICVGRMVRGKVMHRLPVLLELVRERRPHCGLILVGDGPERSRIEEHFASRGFTRDRDVHFMGHLASPKDLACALRAADVFVNPGYVGLAAVDSLFAGIPVVLVAPGPNGPYHSPEWGYLRDSAGGLFAAADQDRVFADRVCDYLETPAGERLAREHEILAYASQELGVVRMAEGLVEFLDRLTGPAEARPIQ